MFLNPGHPLLAGLRFFARVGNTANIPVQARGGGPGVVTLGTGTNTVLKSGAALLGDGTTTQIVFDVFPNYWLPTSKNLTVICRCRSAASQIAVVMSARDVGSAHGWQMLFSNFSGSENGYNFTVFSTNSNFVEAQDTIGATAQVGQDVVVAGVWDDGAHTASIYTRQPGDPIALFRSTNTNTNSGNVATEPWDIRATTNLRGFKEPNGPNHFSGALGWVAIFDRVLTPFEIAAWSRDEVWPFAADEELMALVVPVPVYQPELRHGPPMAGAPWTRAFGEWMPPVFPVPPPPPPPAGQGQVIPSEVKFGPALHGAPWVYQSHGLGSTVPIVPPPPPVPPGAQLYPSESRFGPFPFAPWRGGVNPGNNSFPPPIPPPPPPPPTPVSRSGPAKPLIPRDPPVDPRLRLLTQVVTNVINSLSGSNQLITLAPNQYAITTTFTETFVPGPTNDSTQGAFPGVLWLNTVTGSVYICISAAVGHAVWKLVIA